MQRPMNHGGVDPSNRSTSAELKRVIKTHFRTGSETNVRHIQSFLAEHKQAMLNVACHSLRNKAIRSNFMSGET